MFSKSFSSRAQGGQVMVLTVLSLGGTILAATSIAGLLMLYQVRQTTDLANSARAIFAADAGLEWGLYSFFCESTGRPCPSGALVFNNDARVDVACRDIAGDPVLCTSEDARSMRAVGRSGTASRAFGANF